jgi:hypothetical protein
MQQAGGWPASPLTMLRETLLAIGTMLRGESVTARGRYVSLTDVRLAHPPELLPPIVVGVRGPCAPRRACRVELDRRTGLGAPHIQALPFAAEFAGPAPTAFPAGGLRRRAPRRVGRSAGRHRYTPADARQQLARLDRAGSGHAVLIPAGPDAFSALTSLASLLPDARG